MMSVLEPIRPQPEPAQRHWLLAGCIGAAVAAVTGFVCLLLGVAIGLGMSSSVSESFDTLTTAVVSLETPPPSPTGQTAPETTVPGAGITLELPAFRQEPHVEAHENSGIWAYEGVNGELALVLWALRSPSSPPEISDEYVRAVVEELESSVGGSDLRYEFIESLQIDDYPAHQVGYWVRNRAGELEYSVGVLIGREEDDVFIAVYGPSRRRSAISGVFEQIFSTIDVSPTPPTYLTTDV